MQLENCFFKPTNKTIIKHNILVNSVLTPAVAKIICQGHKNVKLAHPYQVA